MKGDCRRAVELLATRLTSGGSCGALQGWEGSRQLCVCCPEKAVLSGEEAAQWDAYGSAPRHVSTKHRGPGSVTRCDSKCALLRKAAGLSCTDQRLRGGQQQP